MGTKYNQKNPVIMEWAITRLKKGYSPNRIVEDIQKLHGVSVSTMTIYRWRKKHIQTTGEDIPLMRKRKKKK